MSKAFRRQVRILCAVMLLVILMVPYGVCAATKYRVTVLGGLHGTVNGTDKVDVEIESGKQWNPSDFTVKVSDDKYYFKGFHLSGIEGTLEGAQTIEKDMVFVATYGVRGNMVNYTVHYVDEDGKDLLAQKVFQGNPGDRPVVAYQYIEGYVPEAYNLKKTLVETGDNDFVFRYKKVTGTPGGETVIYEYESGSPSGPATPARDSRDQTGSKENNEPEQIIDLDDPKTPTTPGGAGSEGSDNESEPGAQKTDGVGTRGLILGGTAAGAVLLIVMLLTVARHKKEDEEE